MSGTEEKGNNNDEETTVNEDLVNLNTETNPEIGVSDIPSSIPSENIGAISKIISQSPQSPRNVTEERIDNESGDTKVEEASENLINIDKKNQEPNLLVFNKGSGDHTAISQSDSSIIEKETSLVDKKDEIKLMDVSADTADEMELKWDDDEDDDDKSAINDILLEEQLLQDDTSNTEITNTDINNTKLTETHAESSKAKSETDKTEDIVTIDKVNSPVQDINKETVSIDISTLETEKITKLDTAKSPIEDSMNKTVEVIPEPSETAENKVLEVENEEVNKDHNQRVIDIKKIPEHPNTNVKLISTDTEENTKKIVDSPVTNKIPELELVGPVGDALSDENKKRHEYLVEKMVDSPEINKVLDPKVDVSMDNIDVNEEELLKDDENQVVGDDGLPVDNQNKISDKLLKDDENKVMDADNQNKIGDELLKDDESQLIDDDQDVIGKKILNDDEHQVLDDKSRDNKEDEILKDAEHKIMGDDGPSVEDQDNISDKLVKGDENQDKDKILDKVDDELLKGDKNQVIEAGDPDNKREKLLKGDKQQVLDDESLDNKDNDLLKDAEHKVMGDDGPSVEDQDIIGDELLKDDESRDKVDDELLKGDKNQVLEAGDQDNEREKSLKGDKEQVLDDERLDNKDDDLLKDAEHKVMGDDGPSVDDQHKIGDELLKDVENQVKDDKSRDKIDDKLLKSDENQVIEAGDQDNVGEKLLKGDENQVVDLGDAVVDDQGKIGDDIDQKTTDLDAVLPTVDDQNKIGDDIDQIITDSDEQQDQTTKCLDTSVQLDPENIAVEKGETGLVSEIPTNRVKDKILINEDDNSITKSDLKSLDDEPTELSTEESKIDDKRKEITNVTSLTVEDTPVEQEITNNTLENQRKSNIICLDDSPIHIKKAHSLHKPDVMLEIPSQELIDIDAELSINLDQSVPASPEMMDKSEDTAKDIVDENIKDIVEKLDGKDAEIKDTILDDKVEERKDSFIAETVEEGMERMFAEEPAGKETDSVVTSKPAQPTNLMLPDSNDLPEMTDSLGLLAESVRVRDAEGDAVDDDDFDQYESSNQVSPDQSDDSNAPHSETEAVRDQQEKEIESPDVKENEFQFTISNVESTSPEKEKVGVPEPENVETEVDGAIEEDTKASLLKAALLKNGDEEFNEELNEEIDQDQQMDIDTVKLSDTSDSEEKDQTEKLTQSEMKERDEKTPEREHKSSPSKLTPTQSSPYKNSPSKMKKLEIKTLQPNQIVNIVDLQESSSSEDESQQNEKEDIPVSLPPSPDHSVTNVNIPSGIEVMASGGTTSELVSKHGELVVSGVPRPKPPPLARLNTSEVTIKTVSNTGPMVIPETKISQLPPETQVKPKLGLEIFSLDSDEDENVAKELPLPQSPIKQEVPQKRRKVIKCMNYSCSSGSKVPFIVADARIMAFYETGRKRRTMVCQDCADAVYSRAQNLIEGIKKFTPLVDLQMSNQSHELVEISDSESEDDDDEVDPEPAQESIGEKAAKFLEENLADILNNTWKKYDLETRLKETQILLEDEMEQLERETKDLDKVFNDYQEVTDTLRRELYATFQVQREELPALTIVDRPGLKFVGRETNHVADAMSRAEKRRKSTVSEMPAKRPAIPLGYAPLDDGPKDKQVSEIKLEEDKDISVVRLSMELAPADLPPPGTISRPPLRVGMPVYAMKNAFGPWLKGRILEIQPRVANTPNSFSLCRIKFDHKTKTNAKILPARCVAYAEPSDVRMTIGTRLIALFKDSNKRESYYSGVVAEIPNPVNSYRYLVFFDDGYAQYVHHPFTRLVCESSPLVWEEVHPFSRDFVMEYLLKYPERPMVRLHEGQNLKTEWNGKWWPSRVSRVDASLAQVMFVGDGRREWIYRGSTRLAPLYLALRAAERHRPRPMPRSKAQPGSNMPYVEYTRSDEQETNKQLESQIEQQTQEIRHQRAVAKKSTASHMPPPPQDVPKLSDTQTKESRVVYYTPKNAVRPYKMSPHRCGPQCKRSDVLTLKELRTYNPLAKPLLSGWERQLVRFKGNKEVMYRAPCGRRLRNMGELHHYLRLIDCELPVDLFDFNPMTHCLAEFVMHKCLVGKKDLSHGKENVPVPCVNFFDESLPEFCSYNTERTPTAGVPLNLDPEFLCGCDCTDDCADKEKCACWRMTLEGAKTIGLEGPNVGYVYKRLPEPLPSGIYECNSRCKCKDTCLNRVAQHPLQLKLQVFKTENRGWGIRALNDVPKGSFLCVYAGNLLTDATANLDGLNEGDEYLAELDYIEVVEQMKEGYEEDIPEADKKLDKKDLKPDDDSDEESESSPSEEDDTASKTDKEDDDFRPGYIGLGVMEFNKRLRRRSSKKVKDEPSEDKDATTEKNQEKKESNAEEDCITISDDEEVREPSSFTVKAGMGTNDFISKYRSVRSYFGEDEACYIMDAKVQGNIGRYLNHSCCPNVFVQNVFVDTHDPRFPWVAFFALSHIRAGTELTWNYNYDVGSVPGKVLYCYCEAPNCRGRLL